MVTWRHLEHQASISLIRVGHAVFSSVLVHVVLLSSPAFIHLGILVAVNLGRAIPPWHPGPWGRARMPGGKRSGEPPKRLPGLGEELSWDYFHEVTKGL